MKSIYLRNFVAIATMVFFCFLMIMLSFLGIAYNYIISESRSDMVSSANEVARTVSAISQGGAQNSWWLNMSITSIGNATGNHVFIVDNSGHIVSCSDGPTSCMHVGRALPEDIMEMLSVAGSVNIMSSIGDMYQNERFVVAQAVHSPADGELLSYVFVTNYADNILGAWSDFLTFAFLVAFIVLFFAMVTALVYSKRLARPLDEMAVVSRKFARGDFSDRVRAYEDPDDEIGVLIDSFNKMADSLEQADKHRAEFVANISHELRTPMTTIAGFADGILDGTIPPENQDKYLRSIRDETRRLSRLVRDMLNASQANARAADPKQRSAFDLTELVLQTLLSFETRAIGKNLDVDPQLPDNHIMVIANKDAITQVIYNLLDNAVKFAKPGSCLVLRLYKDAGKAYVSVKNFGETIPPEDLPYIFDRFHKSDRSRSLDKDGVGLGLYLVKSIINSHDEDIAVRSEDGWTEFVFTLTLNKETNK